MRLSSRHERWLYVAGVTLLLSGFGWLVSHYLLSGSGLTAAFEFEGEPHPSEMWWLRLHGAAVMAFLVSFGALLPRHIVHGWRRRKNRRTGLVMLLLVAVLVLSGYALYYLSSEQARPWISVAHWIIGLGAGAGMVLHVIFGKRWRAASQAANRSAR